MLTIPANDHGQIRVFATEEKPESLAALFGAKLDETCVDIVRISDLGEMRLTDYIFQGYDMTADDVDLATINAITGWAILVLSRATGERQTALTLAPGLRHVTTYSATTQLIAPGQMPEGATKGVIADPPARPAKSNARIGGMVATAALLVMFALVGLMIWVAG